MSSVVASQKRKAPVVKKTFSLQAQTWGWLSQFSNKSEVVNKALEEYFYKTTKLSEYEVETLLENMEAYKERVGYVSDAEQKEIEKMLDTMTAEDKKIVMHGNRYTL